MNKDFREAKKLLKKAMTGEDNAVFIATEIDGKGFGFQKGRLSQITALIHLALEVLYDKIDNEHDRDVLRDYFIEVLNKKVGVDDERNIIQRKSK